MSGSLAELLLLPEAVALYQLRRNTPPDVRQRASDTPLRYVRERRGTGADGEPFREFRFESGSGAYPTLVRIAGKQSSRSPGWVHCGCPDFRYRWEWALAGKGASSLRKARDERPSERNPGLVAGACKHVRAALDWLQKERGI